MEEAESLTAGNDRLILNLAINYGGRAEIVDAAADMAREVAAGSLTTEEITEESFARHLYLRYRESSSHWFRVAIWISIWPFQ